MNAAAVIVLCTAPANGEGGKPGAAEIARQLVEERLAACVNVIPGVQSFFHWQGRVDVATESLLVVKTTPGLLGALQQRLHALHPYQVPEILEIAVDGGSPAYLRWLVDAVAPPRQ